MENKNTKDYDMRTIAAKAVRDALDDLNIALKNAASFGLHVKIESLRYAEHGMDVEFQILAVSEIAAIQKF